MTSSILKASFYTFGCRLNQAETALISSKFRSDGYDIVPIEEKTDVCVINSCTVTEQADAKCRQLIRKILRNNPDAYVAVVGCYSQTGWQSLQKIDGIDLIVGTAEKLNVLEHIGGDPVKGVETRLVRPSILKTPFTIEADSTNIPTTRANLKIQDGCNFMCSFCIIPFARGRARSRAFWDIQREAISLVESGYQELVITGVNIGTYEYEGQSFLDVIKMLLSIEGLKRLRISSIEPTTIPVELIDIMAESEVLCSHFHIPLQSGSDKILEKMKRLYNQSKYLEFLDLARAKIPDLLLATDIIVGFPGEEEEDFAESCRILEDYMAYAHVFPYSERQGTASQRLVEKSDSQIKKKRSKRLQEISQEKKQEFYQRFIGKTVRVLTEEKDRSGRWVGFSDNYIKVAIADNSLSANQLIKVQIESVEKNMAIGSVALEEK